MSTTSPWIIAGIAVGAFLVVVAIGLLTWAFFRRRGRLDAERKRGADARAVTDEKNAGTSYLIRQWVTDQRIGDHF